MLPPGFAIPPGRTKPWGTSHAIWAARLEIREPFAVLNADDYYGPHALKALYDHLTALESLDKTDYAMAGYRLFNTLSDSGPVARGVCEAGPDGLLKRVVERLKIAKDGAKAKYEEDGTWKPLTGQETASMNLWGFTPRLFHQLDEGLVAFLQAKGKEEKSEYLIPRTVDALLQDGLATVKVLPTTDPWFGLTYPEDLPMVKGRIAEAHAQGTYPERLW